MPLTYLLLCHPDELQTVIALIERWFENDVDVTLSAQGTSEKQGTGVLVLKFEQEAPGSWFNESLDEDEHIIDYIIHNENSEEE